MTTHADGAGEEVPIPGLEGSPVRVTERLAWRDCEACGQHIEYCGRGRRPRFCSDACRQYAWALRAAEAKLGTTKDTRPGVVREVVERVTERPVTVPPPPREPVQPETSRDWCTQLDQLATQLTDESHRMHREHWHHKRLYDALSRVVTALDRTHPGGLDHL
jgi:hypothetical protein